jgi:DNA-binding NarL/FixJ family response regulator
MGYNSIEIKITFTKNKPMETKIVIYEDNHDLRESLYAFLNGTSGFEVAGAFTNCSSILNQLTHLQPDVILMDIDMPIKNGIEGLKIVQDNFPEINVIMLTVFETNDYIFDAIRAGAVGYLLKKSSPVEIIKAIEEIKNGGTVMTPSIARKVLQFFPKEPIKKEESAEIEQLSEREMEVLNLLTKGFTYRMAAYELGISTETIRTYIKRIYNKLHVHSNTEAVAVAMSRKMV